MVLLTVHNPQTDWYRPLIATVTALLKHCTGGHAVQKVPTVALVSPRPLRACLWQEQQVSLSQPPVQVQCVDSVGPGCKSTMLVQNHAMPLSLLLLANLLATSLSETAPSSESSKPPLWPSGFLQKQLPNENPFLPQQYADTLQKSIATMHKVILAFKDSFLMRKRTEQASTRQTTSCNAIDLSQVQNCSDQMSGSFASSTCDAADGCAQRLPNMLTKAQSSSSCSGTSSAQLLDLTNAWWKFACSKDGDKYCYDVVAKFSSVRSDKDVRKFAHPHVTATMRKCTSLMAERQRIQTFENYMFMRDSQGNYCLDQETQDQTAQAQVSVLYVHCFVVNLNEWGSEELFSVVVCCYVLKRRSWNKKLKRVGWLHEVSCADNSSVHRKLREGAGCAGTTSENDGHLTESAHISDCSTVEAGPKFQVTVDIANLKAS
eukprot:766507-Hanusia_phi.AAC.2